MARLTEEEKAIKKYYKEMNNTLERYQEQLKNNTTLNKYARKALLKDFKKNYEELRIKHEPLSREELKELQPYEATRTIKCKDGYNWEIKKKQLKGIISRKALVR